jgi:hypothetical protein
MLNAALLTGRRHTCRVALWSGSERGELESKGQFIDDTLINAKIFGDARDAADVCTLPRCTIRPLLFGLQSKMQIDKGNTIRSMRLAVVPVVLAERPNQLAV